MNPRLYSTPFILSTSRRPSERDVVFVQYSQQTELRIDYNFVYTRTNISRSLKRGQLKTTEGLIVIIY